jgi:hypothetical protein
VGSNSKKKRNLGMNEGTFGYEGVKSCSNGSSRWQGKGLQDPSEWSKFKPVFLSLCVCSPTLLIYFAKECSEGRWKSKF